jgi:uncharacterized protein YcbX
VRLVSISTYPIKGCYRVDSASAAVEPWGLAGDRRWLVVDPDGQSVTQREEPGLTRLFPAIVDGRLIVRSTGMPDLAVDGPGGGGQVPVRLFRLPLRAAPAGAEADAWMSKALGREVRLVYLADPGQRGVSFADNEPVLLVNPASLDALNGWLLESGDEPVPMTRFRPNFVVSGASAWAEDGWVGGRIRVGAVTFRVDRLCDRCVVTTVDQETGERGREPLHVLGRYRKFPGGLMFGALLIPEGTGPVAVGDEVSL